MMIASSTASRLALVLALAFISRSADAQVCLGAAPFSLGNVRVDLGGGSTSFGLSGADGEGALGVQLALGASRGAFAAVGASVSLYTSPDIRFIREEFAVATSDDATSGTLSVSGGYSIALSPSRQIELCPIAGVALQNGPSMYHQCTPYLPGSGIRCDGGVSGSARALRFGGSIGRLKQVSPGFAFVPFAGAAFVSSRIAAAEQSQTDGYVEVSVGAGVVMKRLTVRPTAGFALGRDGGGGGVGGLQLSLNIGPKRARTE